MASCGGKYKITGKTNLIPDGETILLQKQNNEQIRNNYEKKTIDMDRFDRSDYGKLRRKI